MRCWLVLFGLGACTPIYDQQYDDRRRELEAFRTEFLPADADIQRIASGGRRLYWVDRLPPANQNILHSIDPAVPDSKVDYEWSRDDTSIEDFHFSETVVADCGFSTARLYDASATDQLIGMTGMVDEDCAVDGSTVYFSFGTTLDRWAGTGEPTLYVDFAAAGIANSISGFGVIGDRVVAAEGDGDLYLIDVIGSTPTATWLMQEGQAAGNLFFDTTGVLYQAINPSGIRYIRFADLQQLSFEELVADGGYHLNFKHGDIQTPVENDFVIHDRHVIYRGQRGIFAYGLDTGNVIDLLLEEGEGIDRVVTYRNPVVTSGGHLFVLGNDGFSSDGPVYQVDLNGRLK